MTSAADCAVREAHRTRQIAGVVDLDDGEATVLLVIGTQPTIPRTAVLGASGKVLGTVARLDPIPKRQPIFGVIFDQRFGNAVLLASLEKIDFAVFAYLLCRDEGPTGFTQAGRLAVKQPRTGLATRMLDGRVHRKRGRMRSSLPRKAEKHRTVRQRANRA